MKKLFILLLLTYLGLSVKCQLPDSFQRKYDTAVTINSKRVILIKYAYQLSEKKTYTEQIKNLLSQLTYFTRKKDDVGIAYIELRIGSILSVTGDLSVSLKYGISALKIFEGINDTTGLLNAYNLIGKSYTDSKNFGQGIDYWRKSLSISKTNLPSYALALNQIADCFVNMKLPDSALFYIQQAIPINSQLKDTNSLAANVGTMAEAYMCKGQNDIARLFFRQSIKFAEVNNDTYSISYNLNDLAQSYLNTSDFDSALCYAKKALTLDKSDYLLVAATTYQLIYKSFEKMNRRDSANEYFRSAVELKDSVLSEEKNNAMQSLGFQEQIRQQEIETAKEELALKHKHTIENISIALGIICFAILFLLISRSFIANAKLIKFLGILALLLVFEFINLIIHSYIETLTHDSQLLMLLILVGLAAMLIPLHHKIEHWTVNRLLEKNKQLRLAAAKRTIEKLEPGDESNKSEQI